MSYRCDIWSFRTRVNIKSRRAWEHGLRWSVKLNLDKDSWAQGIRNSLFVTNHWRKSSYLKKVVMSHFRIVLADCWVCCGCKLNGIVVDDCRVICAKLGCSRGLHLCLPVFKQVNETSAWSCSCSHRQRRHIASSATCDFSVSWHSPSEDTLGTHTQNGIYTQTSRHLHTYSSI